VWSPLPCGMSMERMGHVYLSFTAAHAADMGTLLAITAAASRPKPACISSTSWFSRCQVHGSLDSQHFPAADQGFAVRSGRDPAPSAPLAVRFVRAPRHSAYMTPSAKTRTCPV
jgi:hypothetical protein